MIYPLGETALVLQAGAGEQARLIAIARQQAQGVAERGYQLILGVGNLTVRFNPLQQSADEVLAWLQQQWEHSAQTRDDVASTQHQIGVCYGGEAGPDLADVAAHCAMSVSQLIEAHSSAVYEVLCIGFLPGFPYLAGLPANLATPRRAEPRVRVPAGSVGIGGAQTGIYPCESPGGWQLIGRTGLALFDCRANPPCRLQAGDRVRFVPQERV